MKTRCGQGVASRAGRAALLVAFALVTSACGDRATGDKLAKGGMATANTLASFYDSLAQDTIDIWEMEAFTASLRGVSFTAAQQKPLQEQVDALNSRARLARRLASTYGALQQLSAYDASGEVKSAAGGLASAINAVPGLPTAGVDPSGIFGSLAGDIAGWQQSRDIRKGSGLLLQTLEKMRTLLDREREAYGSIAEERWNKVAGVTDYLIQKRLVVSWPLLQSGTGALGLPWAGGLRPADDEPTIKALSEVARVRIGRLAMLSVGAGDTMIQALALLIENHRAFQNEQGLSLDEMAAALQKAQSYLDEIEQLRTQKQ